MGYIALDRFFFSLRKGAVLVVDYIKTSEVARLLYLSESGVRKWEREGKLKAVRTATGQRLFLREDVDKLVPKEIIPA